MEGPMPEEKNGQEAQIVVNGTPSEVPSREVSYAEVTKIAYPVPPAPETRYTVTFRNAHKPKEGSLAPGQSVEVKKEGTIFNVKATGKS
jgi:Multiubiquitin